MAKSRVIGLDIASTAVRAVQLEFGSGGPRGKGQPTIMRVGQVDLPAGAVRDGEVSDATTVSQAIRELWKQARFDTKDVVVGIGSSRVIVRNLSLPWLPPHQLKASLPFQVQEYVPMSTDDAFLDFYETDDFEGESGRTSHGLFVAAPKDSVNAHMLAAMGAGLRPTMVDLNALALLRALARGDLAQRNIAIVDIGARITNVVIAQNGVPRLVRMLPQGGHDVSDAVASAMQISLAEAERLKREIGVGFGVAAEYAPAADAIAAASQTLIEGIRNTFTYYAQNHPGATVEVLALSGGGSQLPGLGQYLSSASRVPVTLGQPFVGLREGKGAHLENLRGHESTFALATGLAFGEAA